MVVVVVDSEEGPVGSEEEVLLVIGETKALNHSLMKEVNVSDDPGVEDADRISDVSIAAHSEIDMLHAMTDRKSKRAVNKDSVIRDMNHVNAAEGAVRNDSTEDSSRVVVKEDHVPIPKAVSPV